MKKTKNSTLSIIFWCIVIIFCILYLKINGLDDEVLYWASITGGSIIVLSISLCLYTSVKNKKKIQNLQYTAKFEEFYDMLCHKNFINLERILKQIKKYDAISLGLILINALLVIVAIIPIKFTTTRLTIVLLICLILFITYLYLKYRKNKLKEQYKLQYKQEISRCVINVFEPSLEYSFNDVFGVKVDEQYDLSGFENVSVVEISSKDYIVGRMDNTYMEMCDITTYHNYGQGRSFTFSGIFAVISNKVNINSQIQILNVSNVLNDFDTEYQVDDNEFEKYFSIKTDNKILAARILTHDVTNMILKLYKEYSMRFDIVIKNSTTYIRFPAHHIFKIDIKKEILDKRQIYESFVILQSINEIVSGLSKAINMLDI